MFGSPASLVLVPYAYDFCTYGEERVLQAELAPLLNLWRSVTARGK